MNYYLISGALLIGLLGMQGCALKTDSQQAEETPSARKPHADERYIGGHLYRHGRHIHHHPERTQTKSKSKDE